VGEYNIDAFLYLQSRVNEKKKSHNGETNFHSVIS